MMPSVTKISDGSFIMVQFWHSPGEAARRRHLPLVKINTTLRP
jgi:hypothetical protein